MAGAEQVFRAPGAIIGGGRLLPSPAAFYLTGEDSLRIVSANSVTGVSIKLNWRHAEPNGETKPDSQTHTPNTNRSVKTQDFPLSAGSLLNVTVFASAGSPAVGQTYVMVQLVRGVGAAAIVLGTLLAGYVTTTQALGWPGSPIVTSVEGEPNVRDIIGTQPAAGAEFSETCPTGARWELLTVFGVLNTSAVVANRTPSLRIVSGGQVFGRYEAVSSLTAGTSWTLTWSQNLPPQLDNTTGVYTAPVAQRQFLRAGDVWSSLTANLQVNDQWFGPNYQVREWLEVG